MWSLVYNLYEKRLRGELVKGSIPRYIGVTLDGDRRWAKLIEAQALQGHRVGTGKIPKLLGWASEAGVEIVTLWILPTDNLLCPSEELDKFPGIIADAVGHLAAQKWCLVIIGDLDLLPGTIVERIRSAVAPTPSRSTMRVNIAVGCGERHEITEAVRQIISDAAAKGISLEELANTLADADITDRLYTKDQPDPDLATRTSEEQRLSGFMIWQSAHSEFYLREAYRPDFYRVDLLCAMHSYGQRGRRLRHRGFFTEPKGCSNRESVLIKSAS